MKNHMKCVWMSEEVLNYVSNFEGGSFNQKFENLVLFCMKEEKSKTELLALLDERFRKRSLDLQCLTYVTYEAYVYHSGDKSQGLRRSPEGLTFTFGFVGRAVPYPRCDREIRLFTSICPDSPAYQGQTIILTLPLCAA